MKIVRVALDVPVADTFDFRLPEALSTPIGSLVVVPFGRSRKVGVVVGRGATSGVPPERLRDVVGLVEDVPALGAAELDLFRFCARYYHRALGEVIAASLPPRLRQVKRRAFKERQAAATEGGQGPAPELTNAQREAAAMVVDRLGHFACVLVQGVTGSGKTEVYLRAMAAALARNQQSLFLVPEIGLTPQLEAQVRQRFPGIAIVAAHSHLNEGERASAWLDAQAGRARIVLGTRLAVLMPFASLGLIVVDEENDPSYKQQEGLRYSARDVAVWRARALGIPVVLGSATPSLESYENAREGRYLRAVLPERAAAGVGMPRVRTIDTRADRPRDGLSWALRQAIGERLRRSEQSLLFVNRRGFAPVLYCPECQWHPECTRCSANLVLHLRPDELRCHHCGRRVRKPDRCPECSSAELAPIGHGTQRLEETLANAFPQARIARIDRDSTSRRGSLAHVLGQVRSGEIDILVGTQMLAKGHDYPRLTLVGVLNGDAGLFSADFRASERLYSLLSQVSGRAGRGELPGEVLVQTDFPGHPMYAAIARHDYESFAAEALDERRTAGFPPYAYLALVRAEAKKPGEAMRFLELAARIARERLAGRAGIEVFDPVAPSLERKAGFERAQLLARARSRTLLQRFLTAWKQALEAEGPARIRWSVDVDPQEV